MKENRFGSRVSTIGLIRGRVLVGALLSLAILACLGTADTGDAQGLKEKAEAEDKLMFYEIFAAR
jgi:hypothetical protein